ncbi:AAA family ATPase [Granulibacter bethesdensis]|uniref:Chromosome partition protein Smc n=1 Tax=Granulibacter bethesdensis (strain ATCC BAA-1260 / CGDNIH1) TaxID=391165 RepID=Q0BQZ0_GRABC|nr:AAA family ATPase [Granulibacter bethesdensis]ABI62762.1 Chromosome partition protein smc [Granulibacter bethesdensis CGDNIH1]APH52625.1 Chromosome partition protein smc [Granulibacter bethesdensis]APH65314.1 Chromosome partition protein smc [Granulibacter bethesdensis]
MPVSFSRLRIAGFKSFADPQSIEILPGLTGVVGPNGCGKSNVVEALRWAMGENSARALRGGEMDDVIFAGTAHRSSRNLAEVVLSLEDVAGQAPPPFGEVPELEISRRIERGGGSTYRINGREVRARDVQTLFADLASGARSSAMVSQGRVGSIVNAKPEERRAIMEEAAGITGLHARRHEAELKLRQAETNLERAEELRGQLQDQLGGLQKQARQASRYRNISGLVRQAELEWLGLLQARAMAALDQASTARDAARAALRQAEQQAEAATIAAFEADKALPALREAEAVARTALERRRIALEGQMQAEEQARNALDQAQARLHQAEQDLHHSEDGLKDATEALERLAAEEQALRDTLIALPARQEEAERDVTALEEEADRLAQAADLATARAAEGMAQARSAEADRAAAEQRLQVVNAEHARLSAALAEARAQLVEESILTTAQESAATARLAVEEARRALEQVEAARPPLVERYEAARRTLADAQALRSQTDMVLKDAGSRAENIAAQTEALERDHAAAQSQRIEENALQGARQTAEAAAAALETARIRQEEAETALAQASAYHAEAQRAMETASSDRERATLAAGQSTRRAAQIEEERQSVMEEQARAEASLPPTEQRIAAETALAQAEQALAISEQTLASAETARIAARAAHEQARETHATAQAGLGRLQAEVDGLAALLRHDDTAKGGFQPVSDLLPVPEGLERAVGAALGDALDSALDEAADRFWRSLPAAPDRMQPLPAGTVPLSSLMEPPAALRLACDHIGIIADPATGPSLQSRLHPGQCLVSRDGALWRWDGHCIAAGAPGAAAIRLTQRNRLLTAQDALAQAKQGAEAALQAYALAQQQEAASISAEQTARGNRQQAEKQAAEARNAHSTLAAAMERVESHLTALASRRARLETEHQEATQAAQEAAALLAALPPLEQMRQQAQAAAATLQQAREALDNAAARRREADRTMQTTREEAARLSARAMEAESRLGALSPQLDRLRAEREAAQAALQDARLAVESGPDIAILTADRDAAKAALDQTLAEENRLRAARQEAESASDRATAALAALEARAADTKASLAAIQPQAERAETDRQEAEAALILHRQRRDAMDDPASLQETAETARQAAATAQSSLAAARVRLDMARNEADRITSRQETLLRERADWQMRADTAARHVAELRTRHQALLTEADTLADRPEQAARLMQDTRSALEEAETTHRQAADRLRQAENAHREAGEARRQADADFATAREAILRLDGQCAQAETARHAVQERIEERLGAGASLPSDIAIPPELSDMAEDKARRKLERLSREREEMGPVNLRAEIEAQDIETRIGGIDREKEELGTAIAKLRGSIGHLNREGRERLNATFAQVNTHFQALFNRMFEGGKAYLAMVGDDDPLKAGLEIYAQPPGKKLATLSLLSGGEQALTALSLIFAVFRCNPAPVCVLDEVDAPLDDANVERFCMLLADMVQETGTRFLVVTHHHLTMARMDRLYGVTMQERGISRLLSVDLHRATAMVEGEEAAAAE